MIPQAGPQIARDPVSDYRRLASALASRATRLGSRDPESAAQEALRRSLENGKSQPAVAYYFGEDSHAGATPEWPLDQLLAWLHGVLQYVVREEQSRVGFHREVAANSISEPADASADALEGMIQQETRAIVADCFATLDSDYRSVLYVAHGWTEVWGDRAADGREREYCRDLGEPRNWRIGPPHSQTHGWQAMSKKLLDRSRAENCRRRSHETWRNRRSTITICSTS